MTTLASSQHRHATGAFELPRWRSPMTNLWQVGCAFRGAQRFGGEMRLSPADASPVGIAAPAALLLAAAPVRNGKIEGAPCRTRRGRV